MGAVYRWVKHYIARNPKVLNGFSSQILNQVTFCQQAPATMTLSVGSSQLSEGVGFNSLDE